MKVTPDNLAQVLADIMDEYKEHAEKTLDEAAKEAAKAGAKALQSASRSTFGGTGQYARGWGVDREKVGGAALYTIWNKNKPGLPHLLEFGHAKGNGGRVAGRTHIKPIEQQIVAQFENKVKVDL